MLKDMFNASLGATSCQVDPSTLFRWFFLGINYFPNDFGWSVRQPKLLQSSLPRSGITNGAGESSVHVVRQWHLCEKAPCHLHWPQLFQHCTQYNHMATCAGTADFRSVTFRPLVRSSPRSRTPFGSSGNCRGGTISR